MSLTIFIGLAGLLALLAAITGVVIDKEGKPSILIKSKWIRGGTGIASVSLVATSLYMWDVELEKKEGGACHDCDRRLKELDLKVNSLEPRIDILQSNLNTSISNVYEDSANFLFRVSMMIGKRTDLGCMLEIEQYQKINKFVMSDKDMCKELKLLMHPVTITGANGIFLKKLVRSFTKNGIPSFIVPQERRTNARSKNLAIFYPDGVGKDLICTVRDLYELSFKEKNPSSSNGAIQYALNLTEVGSVQKELLVLSSQAIQLGVNPNEYVVGLKKITRDEWNDICKPAYSQEEFEGFIAEKSSNISLPQPKKITD